MRPLGPLTDALEFITKGTALPFRMVRDIIGCLQHKAHELLHIKGVVGKLRMVPKGGMVTLREALERMCETQKHRRKTT